jgi:predicted membrane protein
MVKCNICNKILNIDKFNIKLTKLNNRYLLGLVILFLLILLFIRNYDSIQSRLLVFMVIFIMTVIISKNLIVSILISIILFLLVNLLINYKSTLEKFQNENEEKDKDDKDIKEVSNNEPSFNKNIFDTDVFKQSSAGIQDLLKTVNGGIELKDDDLKETGKLNIDTDKYSDDKKPNALKHAQKEAYELINTVNALKDTVNTLAPVLSEGKKLMDIFQNLKL